MKGSSGIYASILRSTGVYAAGILAQRAIGLLLLPLYTRYLTPADYGTLELIDVTMSVFSLVVGARVATAVAYFCGKAENEEGRRTVFTTNLFGSALIAGFAILIGWLLSPRLGQWVLGSQDARSSFLLAAAGLAASFPLESLLGRLRVQDRPGAFTAIGIVRLCLSVLFNVVFLAVLGLGYKSLLWSNLLVSGLLSLYAGWSTWREYGIRLQWELLVSMVRFAVPVGVVGLSLFVFHVADRFFLKRYSSLEQIGLYALGYKFGMLIAYVQMAFNQYWHAKAYDLLKSENGRAVFSRGFTYYSAAMCTAAVAAWMLAPQAIYSLVEPAFFPAVRFVPVILVAYLIRALADYIRIVLYSAQRPGLDALSNGISALFCLGAYALLIPAYGAQGAAWATLLTSLMMAATAYFFGRRVHALGLEFGRISKLLAGSAAVVAFYSLFPAKGLIVWSLAVAASLALHLLGVIWLWVLDAPERASIRLAILQLAGARSAVSG